MKKNFIFILCLVLALSLVLCACGRNEESNDNDKSSKVDSTKPTKTSNIKAFPSEDLAVQCLQGILQAQTTEDLDKFLTDDTQEKSDMLLEHYPEGEATVTMRYATQFKNYDIFYYTISYKDTDFQEENITILYRGKTGYQLCLEDAVNQEVVSAYTCTTCGGGGQIITGNPVVCGICSGSGWQHIPNAYFDPALNMWMGQDIGCSGCGGSGQIGGVSQITCSGCGGLGLKF